MRGVAVCFGGNERNKANKGKDKKNKTSSVNV